MLVGCTAEVPNGAEGAGAGVARLATEVGTKTIGRAEVTVVCGEADERPQDMINTTPSSMAPLRTQRVATMSWRREERCLSKRCAGELCTTGVLRISIASAAADPWNAGTGMLSSGTLNMSCITEETTLLAVARRFPSGGDIAEPQRGQLVRAGDSGSPHVTHLMLKDSPLANELSVVVSIAQIVTKIMSYSL